jgi:hypothetical protein
MWLAPALVPFAQDSSLANTDWFGIGLVLAIVGAFLLANSVLIRDPRALLGQRFGRRELGLATIRETMFHRLQVQTGCLLILGGLGLQLYGHYRPPAEGATPSFPTLAVGALLLGVVALELGGWWLSHHLFRRRLREHFREFPEDLSSDVTLMREVGELFGLETSGDDTVPTYRARLWRALDLPAGGRAQAPRTLPDTFEDESAFDSEAPFETGAEKNRA